MKKLLFMLAAVVAVATAQAAYVDWQYSTSEAKSGGSDWTSGYTAYLLTADAWSGISSAVTAENLASAASDSSAFYLASSTKKNNLYSTGASGSAGVRQAEGDSGNYYVILATSDGYAIALNNVAVTAYTDKSGAGTGLTPNTTISTSSAVAGTSFSFTAYSSGGGGTTDVPEPTSGLLLVIGGAMLALRRRR